LGLVFRQNRTGCTRIREAAAFTIYGEGMEKKMTTKRIKTQIKLFYGGGSLIMIVSGREENSGQIYVLGGNRRRHPREKKSKSALGNL